MELSAVTQGEEAREKEDVRAGDYSRLEQVFPRVRVCFIHTVSRPNPEQGLVNSLLIYFAADKSYENVPLM